MCNKADDKYKKGTTGIDYFDEKDGFAFQSETKKIFYALENKSFTLNEFVDLLEKNHLSDRLFWKRKNNYAINIFLKYFFWLSDKNYDQVQVMLDRHRPDQEKKYKGGEKNIEPFFKYFSISKNTLFSSLIIGFFCFVDNTILVLSKRFFTIKSDYYFILFSHVIFTRKDFSLDG